MCDCPRTPTADAGADAPAGAGPVPGPRGALPQPPGACGGASSAARVTRRLAFGAVGGGALVGVLAACGAGDDADGGGAGGAPSPTPGATEELASTEEIPVGEGTVFAEEGVVVTQPQEGTFHAFSSTCTHEGCPVDSVVEGLIQCPCHGSRFSIEDGSPVEGPATEPLEEFAISVENGVISRV